MLARAASMAIATLLACARTRPEAQVHEPVSPAKAPPESSVDAELVAPTIAEPAVVDAPPHTDSGVTPGEIRPVEPPATRDPVVLAKQHFARGVQAFESGDHGRALTEFIAADRLVPKPELRFNIARCRTAMGDLHGARMELQALLGRSDIDDAMRRSVTEALASIERRLGAPER